MIIEINPKGEEFYKDVKCAEDVLVEVEKFMGFEAAEYLRSYPLNADPLDCIKQHVKEIESIVSTSVIDKRSLIAALYKINLVIDKVEK